MHYISPKETLNSAPTTSVLRQQNHNSQISTYSTLHHQIQQQPHSSQINNIPIPNQATISAFSSSSDIETPLHPEDLHPPPPSSSSSSAYPYFTSPTANLSSPYYGSYSSSASGVFSSKTLLEPSRPRSSKSRSHAGKIEHMCFLNKWWW